MCKHIETYIHTCIHTDRQIDRKTNKPPHMLASPGLFPVERRLVALNPKP